LSERAAPLPRNQGGDLFDVPGGVTLREPVAIASRDVATKAEGVAARRKVADSRPDASAALADYSYALLSAGKLDEAEQVARKAAAFPNVDAKPLAGRAARSRCRVPGARI
jgi:Flp pilus assembly protein TadD